MLGHNRDVGSSTENRDVSTHYTVKMRVYRMLAWKTQIWGKKNHDSPQTAKYRYVRITTMGHRGNDLLPPCFATRRLQQRQRPLPLSHTLFLSVHIYALHQQLPIKFALGHIYTNMTFGLFTNIAPVGSLEHICPFHPRRGSHRVCNI